MKKYWLPPPDLYDSLNKEFYFDFASPYSFLAHKEIRRIEKENAIKMKYMHILCLVNKYKFLICLFYIHII